MAVIFDGHNLIGAGGGLGLSLSARNKEKRLLDLLARYRYRKGAKEKYLVVFDGRSDTEQALNIRFSCQGIQVEYSGGDSADDVIVGKVKSSTHPSQMLVVSSDAGVRRGAGYYGAKTSSSREFLKNIEALLGEAQEMKQESLQEGEVEEWLKIFSGKDEDTTT